MNEANFDQDLAVLKLFNDHLVAAGETRCSLSWVYRKSAEGTKPTYYWVIGEREPEGIDNDFETPMEAIAFLLAYLGAYLPEQVMYDYPKI
jgi:hypothetical protein